MASRSLKNRVKAAQANIPAALLSAHLAKLIEQGAYYDELPEEDREEWVSYFFEGISREAVEDMHSTLCGNLHFQIEKKLTTEAELAERRKEVEALIDAACEEYQAEQAAAKAGADD